MTTTQRMPRMALGDGAHDAGTPGPCGMGWWSNNDGEDAKLPRDAFFGAGAGHQIVLVVPSLNLIAVRNGQELGAAASEPARYHQPVQRFLFEPLMAEVALADARQYLRPLVDRHLKGAGQHAVAAADALGLVVDDRSQPGLLEGPHRADRDAARVGAVHAHLAAVKLIAMRPYRRELVL